MPRVPTVTPRGALLITLLAAPPASGLAQLPPSPWGEVTPGAAVVFSPSPDAGPSLPRLPSAAAAGPVALHPHALFRLLRGEGFVLGSLREQDTSIQTTEPGLLARIGRHWRADCTATWTRYSNPALTDTFDSALTLAGEHAAGFWRLQEQARLDSSTGLLLETAAQTRTRRRGGSLSLERDLGRGRLLEAGLDHSRTRVTDIVETTVPVTPKWTESAARVRYTRRLAPDLHASASFTEGRTGSDGADSRYLRPGVGMRWQAGDRLRVGAEVSRERRAFDSGMGRILRSDVTGLNCEFTPSPAMRVTLEAGRTLTPSFAAGEVLRQGLWRAGLRQRLLGQLQFDANFVRRHQDHVPAVSGAALARTDRSRTLDLTLSCRLLRRLEFSLVHRTTRNISSLGGYGFRSRQYGAELSARL